jgi:thiol-disulfide isomerase/thioredoxin
MKYLLFYLGVLTFIFSCQSNTPISKSIDRNPVETVQGIGIYDYESFVPFLNADNDTTYVVNFWATWCSPCVAELPHFEQLYQRYKNTKTRFIFVSLDFEKQLEKKLIPFLKKNKLNGEVIVLKQKGMNDWISKIEDSWTGSIPATIVYNKKGSQFYEQSFDYAELEEAFLRQFNQH